MSEVQNNMRVYEYVRSVPKEAQKAIQAGRLKGKTDINPMWRIKVLTEVYGECGKGWYTDQVQYWTMKREDTGETAVFCSLNLYTREGDGWSAPIYGIGGNTVIAMERNGLYLDDEAYKKAYTDAMSVACKALGVGADVYWSADNTKYTQGDYAQASAPEVEKVICEDCGQPITEHELNGKLYVKQFIINNAQKRYKKNLCWDCLVERKSKQNG